MFIHRSVIFAWLNALTYWGRVTQICVGKLTILGSENGLSSGRRQAIIWTNAGILLIGPLRTNFSEILIEIKIFSLKKIRLKMSSAKCFPFRLGLNMLTMLWQNYFHDRSILGAEQLSRHGAIRTCIVMRYDHVTNHPYKWIPLDKGIDVGRLFL